MVCTNIDIIINNDCHMGVCLYHKNIGIKYNFKMRIYNSVIAIFNIVFLSTKLTACKQVGIYKYII